VPEFTQAQKKPPPVARRFVDDMRAFHSEPNAIERDEIAARQLDALKQHYSGKLRLSDTEPRFVFAICSHR
jgi:hypothetical protein